MSWLDYVDDNNIRIRWQNGRKESLFWLWVWDYCYELLEMGKDPQDDDYIQECMKGWIRAGYFGPIDR